MTHPLNKQLAVFRHPMHRGVADHDVESSVSIHAGIGVRNVLAEWSPLTERSAGVAALLFAVLLFGLGLRAVVAVTL